ncbi:MAG: VirB3 family type IV secretion system protein [Succinivibrio sp.]
MANKVLLPKGVLSSLFFLGCERLSCMLLCFFSVLIALCSGSFMGIAAGVIVFTAVYPVLYMLAREDPMYLKLYIRALRYKKYYSA